MSPHRVAILTDSAADLPDAIAARYAVTVVPVRVNLDQRDYLDKIGLATGEFYLRMALSSELRTSQPPAGDFRRGCMSSTRSTLRRAGFAGAARRAAELADAGAQSAAILAELHRLRPLTLTWAMARDITHAVRGGRIPAWAEPAVRWSELTPIAKVRDTGTLAIAGGLFAKRRAPEAFAG